MLSAAHKHSSPHSSSSGNGTYSSLAWNNLSQRPLKECDSYLDQNIPAEFVMLSREAQLLPSTKNVKTEVWKAQTHSHCISSMGTQSLVDVSNSDNFISENSRTRCLSTNCSPQAVERSRKREASPFGCCENRRKEAIVKDEYQERKSSAPCLKQVYCQDRSQLKGAPPSYQSCYFENTDKQQRFLEGNLDHQLRYAVNNQSTGDKFLGSSCESLSYAGTTQKFTSGRYKTKSLATSESGKSFTSHSIHEDLNSLCLTDKSPSPSTFSVLTTTSVSGDIKSESTSVTSMDTDDISLKLPLWFSLFPNVPPTLYFSSEREEVIPLPAEVRQLLLWKLTTITPILIRQAVKRSGYQLTRKSNKWVGTWSKHMKCAHFKGLKDFQKVNHYPGSFHLGRKDRLWRNISKMQNQHGDNFDFIPETYILPQDTKALQKVWDHAGTQCWIIKPPASARGTGVHVVHKWSQIPKKQPAVVQRYLADPYLINGTKFDLRVYVLITSFDPLRIYVFDDGLVRFASVKYTLAAASLGDRFVHLTNYSINKNSATYKSNQNESVCQGHKWTLKALWKHFQAQGIDTAALWNSIIDIVIKTILSCEAPIRKLIDNHTHSHYTCFELFGFDIMLDKMLKPWLLEVNISPSLHSASSLDISVKGQLVKDMLNIAGYKLPPKVCSVLDAPFSVDGTQLKPESVCLKKELHIRVLSDEEKIKHRRFERQSNYQDFILKTLTPDDVRCLMEAEDELVRCGHFQRVFPTATSRGYLRFLNHVTYYNRLLDTWERRYYRNRSPGIHLLQALCAKNYHLQVAQPLTTSQESNAMMDGTDTSSVDKLKKEISNLVVLKVGRCRRRNSSLRPKSKKQSKPPKLLSGQPLEQ